MKLNIQPADQKNFGPLGWKVGNLEAVCASRVGSLLVCGIVHVSLPSVKRALTLRAPFPCLIRRKYSSSVTGSGGCTDCTDSGNWRWDAAAVFFMVCQWCHALCLFTLAWETGRCPGCLFYWVSLQEPWEAPVWQIYLVGVNQHQLQISDVYAHLLPPCFLYRSDSAPHSLLACFFF